MTNPEAIDSLVKQGFEEINPLKKLKSYFRKNK